MRVIYLVSGLLLLGACQADPEPVSDIGLNYFPLKVGAYQIYSVDETQIKQSVETKFVYELKVHVMDSLVNQEGGYTYIIQRQKRDNADLPWTNLDSWTARIANRKAILTEGNTSFVKLLFPVENGLEWDGNAFNTLGGEQSCGELKDQPCDVYSVENAGDELTINGTTFADAVVVVQNNDPDVIVKFDLRKEIYASAIGLIYKESTMLEYCTDANCLGQQKVDNGLKYKQTLKEYGSD